MSGYRVDSASNHSAGEALLMRALPLNTPFRVSPNVSEPLYGGSVNYKDVYYPFLDTLIVSSPDGSAASVYDNKQPVAHECMLTWCIKTIKSAYTWGNYEEIVTETFLNLTAQDHPYPWESIAMELQGKKAYNVLFHDNISIYSPTTDSLTDGYGVSNETFSRTQVLFDDVFPSSITVASPTAQPWWRVLVSWWGDNNLRSYDFRPLLAPNNIIQSMEGLATAMTNTLRSHQSHEFVVGPAYTQTTFIAVHWGWLAFPLTLLLLTSIFLVATIRKTSTGGASDMGVWKTSAMPTLIYGLPKDVQQHLPSPETWGTTVKTEKQVKIKLMPEQGWRVSGQQCLSPRLIMRRDMRAPAEWI